MDQNGVALHNIVLTNSNTTIIKAFIEHFAVWCIKLVFMSINHAKKHYLALYSAKQLSVILLCDKKCIEFFIALSDNPYALNC